MRSGRGLDRPCPAAQHHPASLWFLLLLLLEDVQQQPPTVQSSTEQLYSSYSNARVFECGIFNIVYYYRYRYGTVAAVAAISKLP
eukprot:COSAG02_NODE_1977_length_10205_cov_5.317633_10_plen_85_part_00